MTIEECIENYEETGNTDYYTYVDNIRVDLTLVWESFRVAEVYSIYGESVDASDNNLTLAIKAQDLDTWSCS
jgi:hypothetical protein